MIRPPPPPTPFPYTTLFRSDERAKPELLCLHPLRSLQDERCLRGGPQHEGSRSEEHTSELQSLAYLVCRLLLEKKNTATESPAVALVLSTSRVEGPVLSRGA